MTAVSGMSGSGEPQVPPRGLKPLVGMTSQRLAHGFTWQVRAGHPPSYAGMIRMLRSTACTECVSAPTEMKSTPVSA
jgi:hypothetical protein